MERFRACYPNYPIIDNAKYCKHVMVRRFQLTAIFPSPLRVECKLSTRILMSHQRCNQKMIKMLLIRYQLIEFSEGLLPTLRISPTSVNSNQSMTNHYLTLNIDKVNRKRRSHFSHVISIQTFFFLVQLNSTGLSSSAAAAFSTSIGRFETFGMI